jgi:hypothetical protein
MEEATPIVREKLTTGIAGRFQLLPPFRHAVRRAGLQRTQTIFQS